MGAFADSLKKTATDLIDEFGEDIVLDYRGEVVSSNTIKGFLDPYKPEDLSENIVSGDVKILISYDEVPSGINIQSTSLILANQDVWEVQNVSTARTQGDSILIEAHCRRVSEEGDPSVERPRF